MSKTKHRTTAKLHTHATRGFNGDIAKIKHALAEASDAAKYTAGKLLTQQFTKVTDTTTGLQDGVEEYVIDQPLKALVIAGLTGIAIGLFMRR
jgi:ElaB/YqjD/DUF883 family membrane-anchored ribosome-binding protein